DAALRGAVAVEGALQRRELAGRRETFDRRDRAPGDLAERHQAGTDRCAIEQHGAGAAITGIAADLGAGEAEIVAQQIGKAPDRLGPDRYRAAVEPKGDAHRTSASRARATRVRAASSR